MKKINFKLKEEQKQHGDKYVDNSKQVQISYHDLTDEVEVHQALLELKN